MKLISNIRILIWTAVASLMLTACWDDNEAENVVTNYYNDIVTSFTLQDNSNVADKLSSYSFTIDNFGLSDATIHSRYPNDGIIFNADSLPYGVIPDSIKVTMSYSRPDSAFFCLYSLDGKLQQFSNVASDSALFFASYPDIRLNISARGNRKVYHVKINVHKVAGDTVKWRSITDELWADTKIADQRADTLGTTVFWFVESGTSNQVITSDLKANVRQWSAPASVNVEGGELIDLQTLYSWHKNFYATGKTSGCLLSSADGYNWQVANNELKFTSILGNQLATKDVYGHWNRDSLSAIVRIDEAYHFAVSADAKTWRIDKVIPQDFPIAGFSRPVSVAARAYNGNITSRLYIVGGMLADGRLTSSTWSCDGFSEDTSSRNWAEFPHGNLPAMAGCNIIEYTLDQDKPKSLWLLQPGLTSDGQIPQIARYGRNYATLYFSEDNGVSWHRLYDNYPKMADNSAFSDLVPSAVLVNPDNFEIYLFGGKKTDGSYGSQIWSGVLPSLNFIKVR